MMTKATQLFIALGAGAFLAPMALAQHSAKAVPASDRTFMIKAAQGGMGEVALGHLAQAKAHQPGVKQFGARMVSDHTKANTQLKQVAAKKGVMLPAAPGPEEMATKARLSKLSGSAFDKAYVSDMVEDHEKDVADFEKEAATGKDPAVKAFAAKTLPTLKMHLKMVRALQSKS